MSLLARIRLHRPEAAAAPVAVPDAAVATAAPELGDDDLEQVVGGLERVFIPGLMTAGG